MKAVIQRVKKAEVSVDGKVVGSCENGFMILFCAVTGDTEKDIELLAKKTVNLRVFNDSEDKMNLSLLETGGQVLCVSQFTLAASTKKGNRPSFINAMEPNTAKRYYDEYCKQLENLGVKSVQKGIFGEEMLVTLQNDGPVTIIFDTDVWNKKGEKNES